MTVEVQWPGLPTPGVFVRLPLQLPPMLLRAVDYAGEGRYVAMHWSGGAGGDLMLSDGALTIAGSWPGWQVLTRHELGRVVLSPYDFGDLHDFPTPATHWLLADQWERTLDVGLHRDVEQLLITQPNALTAMARELGEENVVELLTRTMAETARRSVNDILDDLATLERERRALAAWLDAMLTGLTQHAQGDAEAGHGDDG